MSAGVTAVVIIAAVLVLAALVYAVMRPTMRTQRLRKRFGPEYDRAVAQHGGDEKRAQRDLEDRLRRHRDLDIKPLPQQTRELFALRWTQVQERFVDAPAQSVAEADRLVDELLTERGYPVGKHDETMAALSVHHAGPLQRYRDARTTVYRAREGQASTEELREALVGTRELFNELLGDSRADERPYEPVSGVRDKSRDAGEDGHRGAGGRLGALVGRGHGSTHGGNDGQVHRDGHGPAGAAGTDGYSTDNHGADGRYR